MILFYVLSFGTPDAIIFKSIINIGQNIDAKQIKTVMLFLKLTEIFKI
jgi:hypothetical protein